MSLYRTYRPQSLADVVGQDHVVTTLENAAKLDKLAHAYLFAGSRGTGKTSIARILAKILMIRGIADETLQKQIVRGVEQGNIVDLLEIDAASNRGIDDIRDLIEKIQFSPVVATAKVYIIDEAHMLTKEAFNALLKTLEEPPEYAHFILATTELNKIPATIQSRCQCFPFRRIREEDIIRRLQYIADQEHIVIDREALRLIAHHVEGGLRDAISLLDQMRALEKISVADVEERIGGTSREHIELLETALQKRDEQAVIKIIRTLEETGIPLDLFLRQLLALTRKSMHSAIENGESIDLFTRVLDTLLEAIRDLRISPVPGLVIEAALLSLCRDEQQKKSSEFRLLRSEKESKVAARKEERASETPSDQIPTEEQTRAKTPLRSAIVEAKDLSFENLQEEWTTIIQQITPAAVKISLKNGRLQALDGTNVVVTFSSSFHRDTVAKDAATRTIEATMERLFRRSLRLQCILEEELRKNEPTTPEESVNVAEAAAEIF